MSRPRAGRVEQHLHQVAALTEAQTSDRQLLAAFLDQRDEAAFTALVRRYGPMVLGICRRLLRHEADADDAFQATFLVLVRRAAQVGARSSLGNWLYGVAYRTALHARTLNARRRRIEGQVQPRERTDSPEEAAMRPELQQLLDEELNRLPQKYREVIVLCDLLGKTKREAGEQLRCPEGTVSSRLARGHERLRSRLVRRGVTLSVGALAAALAPSKAPASITLIDTTVKAAALVAAGNLAAAGGLAPQAAVLLEGVLKSMLLTKLKITVGLILVIAVLGTTTTLIVHHSLAGPEAMPPNDPPKDTQRENKAKAKEDEKRPADRERFRYGGKDFAYWQEVLQNDLQPEMRIQAIKALGAFADHGYADEAIATILKAMRGPDSARGDPNTADVTHTAQITLANIGPEVLPTLAKEWEDGNTKRRRFVAGTLKEMATYPETIPLLLRVAKDRDAGVRYLALEGLVSVQPQTKEQSKEIEAVLFGVLEDEEKSYNVSAALKALLRRPRASLRGDERIVGSSYGGQYVVTPNTVPTMLAVLESTHSAQVRLEAIEVLRALGPDAKDAVPMLKELLDGKKPEIGPSVRKAATEALEAIQNPQTPEPAPPPRPAPRRPKQSDMPPNPETPKS